MSPIDALALLTGAAFASSLYVFAYRRKGRVDATPIGSRIIEIQTAGAPADVFAAIGAIGPPYRVDDQLEAKHTLVLSSPPSIWSYGFLYPIVIRARDGGGSTILVGVCSRLIHVGPGMGHAQARCAKAIEELLTVPPARLQR